MRETQILNLAECAEMSHALQAPPSRFVHGLVWLLIGLLGTAVGWASSTRMDLVVRAGGRVRPIESATKIFNPVRGEVLSGSSGGRVAEVHFHEGDEVKKGDLLIRFNTERLDNEIVKLKRIIKAGEADLADLLHEKDLLARQFAATRAKGEAEVLQAKEELRQAKEKQETEVRSAQATLDAARDELARLQRLSSTAGALPPSEVVKVETREKEAREQLARAKVPLDEGRPKVAQLALVLAEKEYALKQQDLDNRQRLKQSEGEKAHSELANLEMEHSQAVLLAPVDGVITSGDVKVGDLIGPGQRVLEIAEQKGFRFEILVPSEEVGHLRVGMPVRIKLDAYDYQKYGTLPGTVSYVSPDSVEPPAQPGSSSGGGALAAAQRSAVFLVKIDLDSDELGQGELRSKIKLGLFGQAEIVTGHENLLGLLLKKIRQSISLG